MWPPAPTGGGHAPTDDPADHRGGYGELRALVVDGGPGSDARAYALFAANQEWHAGVSDARLTVRETLSTDAAADALLWQTLFDVDLVQTVAVRDLPPDDPCSPGSRTRAGRGPR